MVSDEMFGSNLSEQRIVNHLDGPDQTHKGPSNCVMNGEEPFHDYAGK